MSHDIETNIESIREVDGPRSGTDGATVIGDGGDNEAGGADDRGDRRGKQSRHTRIRRPVYKTIGQVAQELGVTTTAIRYWEARLKLRTRRGKGYRRYYAAPEVNALTWVKRLTRDEGFTVEGAIRKIKSGRIPAWMFDGEVSE